MKRQNDTLSIKVTKQALGSEMCKCILFAHAMSGCDTTSSFFRQGKVKLFNMCLKSEELRNKASVFGDKESTKEMLHEVGEEIIAQMYAKGTKKGVDELRFQFFTSPNYVPIERMPPTSRSCYFHSLRVHHQVSTWLFLRTVLDKEQYGFSINKGSVVPIMNDQPAAPKELLQCIRCSCKTSTPLCKTCGCVKAGLSCSVHCACEAQCQNSQSET